MSVHLIATGGTIASLADPTTGAHRPAVAAEELVRGVPGLDACGPIMVEEVDRVSGWNITPARMCEVARRVRDALADGSVDGAVVTHGTDTVEETAFLVDVTVASEKPVAFAAAMRGGDPPIGIVTPGAVRIGSPPSRRVELELPDALEEPVPIVQTYTGLEPEVIETVLGEW